jgi:hypothetical protein
VLFRNRKGPTDPLELKFGIAPPEKWSAGKVASPARLLLNLDDDFETPQLLLKEALFQTQALNRTSLGSAKRLKIGSLLLQRLWPTLAAARDALRKNEDGVPEPAADHEFLDTCDKVIQALTAGYQLAIDLDYRADGRSGKTETSRILEATIRILELSHLRQRFRALRFQALPASTWSLVNTLFCVVSRARVEDVSQNALCDDRLLLDGSGGTTARRIYGAIQAFGLFDCFSWSKRQQRFLDSYCGAVPDALVIRYGPDVVVGGVVRFTSAHHGDAPMRSATPGAPHGIVIDCNALAEAVRRDRDGHRQELGQTPRPTSSCIANLSPLSRRPILHAMLRSLEHGVPPHRPTEGQPLDSDFRLETGFQKVSVHLRTVFSEDAAMQDRLKRDASLAGRSASQIDTADPADSSRWRVLMRSERHTVISTKETRYTKPISIGAPAVYGVDEDGFMRPALGEVARIVRLENAQIIIGITRRARFTTLATAITKLGSDPTDADEIEVPCFLAYDDLLGWCVVSSAQQSLPTGGAVQIRTRKLNVTTTLRRLRVVTPHFLLFELGEITPRLRAPTYPSPRRQHHRDRIVKTSQMIDPSEPDEDDMQQDSGPDQF